MSSMLRRKMTFGAALLAPTCGAVATSAREAGPLTAEEALENARDRYFVDREAPADCSSVEGEPETGEEDDTIVVCRTVGEAWQFQTRDGPRPGMGRTAGGAPGAPDVSTIPPCGTVPGGFGVATCADGLGWAPPPVLMVDLGALPEPLSAEDSARVFRADDVPADAARQGLSQTTPGGPPAAPDP